MNGSVARRIDNVWMLLKVTYGLLFVVAGADKFFNLIVNWHQYVSPMLLNIVPYETLKVIIAVVEVLLGLLVLTKWTRLGAYGIALWFFVIVVNLLSMWNYLDIAARDTVLAIGAIALAQLTEAKEELVRR